MPARGADRRQVVAKLVLHAPHLVSSGRGTGVESWRASDVTTAAWVCEAHDEHVWMIEGESHCEAPGVPCPDCNPMGGKIDPPGDAEAILCTLRLNQRRNVAEASCRNNGKHCQH